MNWPSYVIDSALALAGIGAGFAMGWAAKRDRHYPPGYTWRIRRIDRARRKLDRLTS
jgi:hypothetical protein